MITVVSLVFPQSSERGPKVIFWQCQKNKEEGWINFQKQIYGKIFEKNVYFSKILRSF